MKKSALRLSASGALAATLFPLGLRAADQSPRALTVPSCRDGEAISQAITKNGLAVALAGWFDTEEGWERLLSCIRTGDTAWLRVATQVDRGLDGAGPGEIAGALGDALERNPAGVLRLLKHGYSKAGVICGWQGHEDLLGDFHEALARLRRQRRAVEALDGKGVEVEKAGCVNELRQLEKWIKQHKHDRYGL
jgi:hypothetical protein